MTAQTMTTSTGAGTEPEAFTWAETGNVMRSEWTKIRSVRSTMWTLVSAVVLMLGVSALLSALIAAHWDELSAEDIVAFDATEISLAGLVLAQLSIVVLGVMTMSGEYRTGMIRTTLMALPRRWELLIAKGVVFTALTFVVGLTASFGSFFLGQALLSSQDVEASLSDPGVLRAVFGSALFLSVTGLFGLAMGTLLRHTAGAITAMVGLLFIIPTILTMLPGAWADKVQKYYLPSDQIVSTNNVNDGTGLDHPLGPWAGFGMYCLQIAVVLVLAGLTLHRRDA